MTTTAKVARSDPGTPRRTALGLAAVALACLAWGGSALGAMTTHTVVIEATSYAPQRLTIKSGDTVVWINKDPFPHTVTAAGHFDSKSIPSGGTWTYTARKPGTVPYTCTFHPNMQGQLIVE